jgi:sulfur dioxygenase
MVPRGRSRTTDTVIFSHVLYQLSYLNPARLAGIWEVQPHWVQEHLREVQVIDVREPDEFDGPLGRIPGAVSIPLGALAARACDIAKDRPTVAVCRAGGRSAQATNILKKAGFDRVANLAGGMLRWRAQRLAVEGAKD